MKKYVCPECGKKEVFKDKKYATCKACGHKFDVKRFSKLDMHFGKHLPGYTPYADKKPTPIPSFQQPEPPFQQPETDLVKKKVCDPHKSIQHFEPMVSRALRSIPNLWYMKIQVNPLAHHPTVGDYMILTKEHNIVLECKELDLSKNNQIPFTRFSQLNRMYEFKLALPQNEAHIGILLWNARGDNKCGVQDIYIIPVDVLNACIKTHHKKSFNATDVRVLFENYKVPFGNLTAYIQKYWADTSAQ